MTPDAMVIDASVAAAWFLPNEATAYTEAALDLAGEADLWVPALWCVEMTNLFLMAQRRKRIDDAERRQMVAMAEGLRIKVDREAVAMSTLDALAKAHDLTAYDAAYLELALRRRLPMATLDKALLAAMRSSGVNAADLGAAS